MSIKEILIAVHNQAIDDLSSIHNNNGSVSYMEAVMDCYEEVLRQLNVEETDEILEEILNINPNSMTNDNTQQVNEVMEYRHQLLTAISVNGLVGVGAINLGIRMLLSPSVIQALTLVDTGTRVALVAPVIATSMPMVLVILWIANSLFPQSMGGKWGNKTASVSDKGGAPTNDDNNTNVNQKEITINNSTKQISTSTNNKTSKVNNKMFLTNNSVKQYSKGSKLTIHSNQINYYANILQGYELVPSTNLRAPLNVQTLKAIQTRDSVEASTANLQDSEVIRVGDREYAFDYKAGKIALSTKYNTVEGEWELDWKPVRSKAILQFVCGNQVQIEEYVDSRVIMAVLANSLRNCGQATYKADNLVSAIKDRLIITNNQYGQVSVKTDIMGNPVSMNTPEWHWEQNKVNVFALNEKLIFCSGASLTKDTFHIVNNSVNANVPVITDKQATKYLVVAEGAEAMGVFKVNDNLVSFNPLGNTNKGANRIASGNSKGGQFADTTFSSLVQVLSNGDTTATHGKVLQTVVALGLACVAQGELITNAQDFSFSIKKEIRVEVNTTTLGINSKSSYSEVQEAIADIRSDLIGSGQLSKVIGPKDEIEVGGVVIYRNTKEVFYTLNGEVEIKIGKCGYGGRPSTLKFIIPGVAVMSNKKNIKARGESVKATSVATTRETFCIDNNGVADNNWEVLLHSESFKTVHKLLALFANDKVLEGKTITHEGGVVKCDGEEVSQEDFNAWVLSKLERRVIRRLVCDQDVEAMEDALLNTKPVSVEINGKSIQLSETPVIVPSSRPGFKWVEQSVAVIVGFSHFQVEVCTADEWFGMSKTGIIEQHVLGTFHPKLAKAFADKSNKGAEALKYVATTSDSKKVLANEGLMTVSLDNKDEFQQFMTKIHSACKAMNNEKSGVKGMLQSLASNLKQEGNHSLRLQFNYKKTTWNADVPVKGMIEFGKFDKQGNPSNDFCEGVENEGENEVDDAVSVIQNFTNLLSELKFFKGGNEEIKDIFIHYQAHISSWLNKIQTSKIASNLVKGHDTAHLKVIPSFTIGWYTHTGVNGDQASVPNLGFASDSPIWNDINVGDVVLATRMPFPTAVAFRAVVDESIDRTMVSLSPILMSKGNRGDFDGDGIYILNPRKVCGASSYKMAEEFNKSLWSLKGYNKVVSQGASNPVVNTVIDTFDAEGLVKKFFTISSSKSSQEWGTDLEKVNRVYSQFVGMTYGWAFDATVKLFEGNQAHDEDAVLSVINRWLSYEEDTLGGYSEYGYNAVLAFKDRVDNYSGNTEISTKPQSTAPTGAWAKMLERKGINNKTTTGFAIKCASGLAKAKEVERGERDAKSVDALSLSALAIRRLTSRKQFSGEINFFAVAHEYGAKTSRSTAIANLASTTPIHWSK